MSKVRVLPPEIVSKIAAGEVIDRPASVIKELIENALDAKTESIELNLKDAGKMSIHLKDTGQGIDEADIEKIFARHATSKIKTADDLFNIHSLGFRGEALYSIAAIADIVLRSKTKSQPNGWEIHLRGGEKLNLKPCTMRTGTDIEVKELFFNTPARRKFLKSNSGEITQILNTAIPYTLLYPSCRFFLEHQNKTIIDLQPTKDLLARVAEVLNLEKKHLLTIKRDISDSGISIQLVVGDINISRSRRDLQFIFVNNRPVQSKAISFHLNEVYRLVLPPGHYPFFAAFIQYPAQDIDVNIHPTKREIKIKDESTLCALLRQLCEELIMTSGGIKEAGNSVTLTRSPIRQALSQGSGPDSSFAGIPPSEIFERPETAFAQTRPTEQYSFPHDASVVPEHLFKQKNENLQARLARGRYIGSFINKFLLYEVDQSLLVIDQHAAQERITFEHFILQMQRSKVEVQHLLAPYIIKLSKQEFLNWEEAQEKLEKIGFTTNQFDKEAVAVQTYPVLLKDPEKAFRDILAGGNVARVDHETIARRACRASIMAGDPLTHQQAEFQREQLMKCRDPFTCPHGRPTIIELSENFLDKQFLRT